MITYATPDDMTQWTGGPAPDNAVGLLRFASSLTARATRTATYPTRNGEPYGPVVQTLRDATTAQAAFWAANGLDPVGGALGEQGKGHATSKTIKGASVGYSVTLVEKNNQARTDAVDTLCAEAWNILDNAGLINTAPRVY